MMNDTIHLVLTHHWYDETLNNNKRIEYRKLTPHWKRLIWERRSILKKVRFARGYTKTTKTYEITKIDIGSCPIEGWDEQYYRIHFK